MPKQSTAVAQKTDVEIAPHHLAELQARLAAYAALKFDLDLLAHQMDIEKLAIQSTLDEVGVDKVKVDGYSVSFVRGMSSTLDKVKFVELGGSLEMLENATVTKPKKSYISIRKGNE